MYVRDTEALHVRWTSAATRQRTCVVRALMITLVLLNVIVTIVLPLLFNYAQRSGMVMLVAIVLVLWSVAFAMLLIFFAPCQNQRRRASKVAWAVFGVCIASGVLGYLWIVFFAHVVWFGIVDGMLFFLSCHIGTARTFAGLYRRLVAYRNGYDDRG